MRLTTGNLQTPVTPLSIVPSTRQFSIPVMPEDDENDAIEPAAAVLGDQIRLAGFEVVPMGEQTGVTFLWQALVAPVVDAKVFVHIVDAAGNIVAQSDAIPSGYHTNQWVTGEYVLNTHQLEIPPGAYQLRVGMYDPVTMTRLPAIDDRGARYPDDAITLGGSSSNRLRSQYGSHVTPCDSAIHEFAGNSVALRLRVADGSIHPHQT
ncbi:MAG: hypothetical protein IPK16_02310 [Anaerolineales bacterium]|nr:hypothetical protein [Anaerolineales bacterium]